MVEIGKNAKIKVHWNVLSYDFSQSKADEIRSLFAKKYGKDKDDITVVPEIIIPDGDGDDSMSIEKTIEDISNPELHKSLFNKYLDVYKDKVGDYDIETINEIDNSINARIENDYSERYRRFSIKWIKWSNFGSFGSDNYFDFSNLKGLVLLNGEPANESGKTTFAIRLLRFLLFGDLGENDRQDGLFNNKLPEETQLVVEGCIRIENEDYIIKRVVTRPSLKSRTDKSRATQKVEYYKIVGDTAEELQEFVDENGADTKETNKIIKESIGNKDDFDLMMCIEGDNLSRIIDMTPTELGNFLARWIGLSYLETKDVISREIFNDDIKTKLTTRLYNREDLKECIAAYETEIKGTEKDIEECKTKINDLDEEIKKLEEEQGKLLDCKKSIDKDIMSIDMTTLQNKIDKNKKDGAEKLAIYNANKKEIEKLGEVKEHSKEEVEYLKKEVDDLKIEKTAIGEQYKAIRDRITELKEQESNAQFCPKCGARLTFDYTPLIKENEEKLKKKEKDGKDVAEKLQIAENKLKLVKEDNEKVDTISKLKSANDAFEAKFDLMRIEQQNLKEQKRKYLENEKAIKENNDLDIRIGTIKANINSRQEAKEAQSKRLGEKTSDLKQYKKDIERTNKNLEQLARDEKLEKNWKIYLDMVGKNGIRKMVLRTVLPTINAIIAQLLDDVCDFSVSLEINEKNEINTYFTHNGASQKIKTVSGFEKTVSALAIRGALSRMTTIPRMNFLVFDELLGKIASINYDNVKLLYDRILQDYDFILNITHIDAIRDWHDNIVTVIKENDISRIKLMGNDKKVVVKSEKQTKKRENKKSKKTTKND